MHRGSAAHRCGSAAPGQVLVASFCTPMASFGLGCIYAHPMHPGLVSDDQNFANHPQSLMKPLPIGIKNVKIIFHLAFMDNPSRLVYQEICLH
jgi:hypothetical protein